MTINFYLNKKKNQSEHIIFLYLRGVGGTIKIHTKEKINPKYWDKNKQLVKGTYRGSDKINDNLMIIKDEVHQAYRLLINEDHKVPFDIIKKTILDLFTQKQTNSNDDFFSFFDEFIAIKTPLVSYRTIQRYITLKNHLFSFQNDKNYSLEFSSIDIKFYNLFFAYSIDKLKHNNNTFGKYLVTLKTFLHWATESGYNGKKDFIKFKKRDEESEVIYLSEEELMKLYYFDFGNNKTLEKIRDVFCFASFTGQRFSDIERIKWNDIKTNSGTKGASWFVRTQKTHDQIEVPLNEFALEIINKYKTSDLPLPVISQQRTNEYLKKMGKLVGIDEETKKVSYQGAKKLEKYEPKYKFLSTHTARRTFVTLCLEKGMRPETLMTITGHKDFKTMRRYIKITSLVKHNEMKQIWNK
ncbi:MAG: tyrosine-type recombinase/integrase [bacterium]